MKDENQLQNVRTCSGVGCS